MTLVIAEPVAEPAETGLPETIEVVVTLEDIQQGISSDAQNCAIALALKRAGYYSAAAGASSIHLGRGCEYPGAAEYSDWIRAFDHDKSSVAPERFVFHRKH